MRTPSERFWKYVAKGEPDACWLWTGGVNQGHGYGQFRNGKSPVKAHRFSYEIHVGPIPDGLAVLHRCDVKACVNPAHLFLGTQADNIADMIAKGRRRVVISPKHGPRLSPADHAAIRASNARPADLARMYRVHPRSITNIRTGVFGRRLDRQTCHELQTL